MMQKFNLRCNGILFPDTVSHIILLDISILSQIAVLKRIYECNITGKLTDKRSSILKQQYIL